MFQPCHAPTATRISGFVFTVMCSHFLVTSGSLRLNFAMARPSKYPSEHVGSTGLRVQEEADRVMDRIESYFIEVGASIQTRTQWSIKAEMKHPDGFAVRVSAKYYADVGDVDGNIVDIRRRSGDVLLFDIIYRQFLAYDFGRGEQPQPFYGGQMCPRVVMKPQPDLAEPSAFRLELGGEKRKRVCEPDP